MAHTPLHTLTDNELLVVSAQTEVPARDRKMARTILVNRQVHAQSDREANAVGAVKGYADGFGYGLRVGSRMSPERRRENDRYVAGTEYVGKGSPTRGYWLGFRRALRGGS